MPLRCPLCDSQEWIPSLRVRKAALLRCSECRLLGTGDFIEGIRRTDGIYDVGPKNYTDYQKFYLPKRLPVYKRTMPRLEKFRRTNRLLEVGSSYGYFLELASGMGWQAEGVEIATYPIRVARSRGCKIVGGSLESVDLLPNSYDIVIMWDVIEHFSGVRQVIQKCASLLRPGGALVMRTPDARALECFGGLLRTVYRHAVYPANTAEHVFHFTPENMQALLQQKGFVQFAVDDRCRWEERVIGGRNPVIRFIRSAVMRHAHRNGWPYEFLIEATKTE